MIVFVLSILLIGLAGLERVMYIKNNYKDWDKVRVFIGALITVLLFLISFYITDTTIGLLNTFLSISIFILIGIVHCRSKIEWIKYSSYIIGLPVMVYLLIQLIQNILINPRYIIFLILVINLVLSYSYNPKGTAKENIAFSIGFAISLAMVFSYYKTSGLENGILQKQELVALKYLEEELGAHGFEVYADRTGSLRGEETTVRAYDSSGTFILLIYKNNKIASYDMKDR